MHKIIKIISPFFKKYEPLIIILGIFLAIYPLLFSHKVSVIYNIEKTKESDLKVFFAVKVKNNGDINLKSSDFDKNLVWGLEIVNGGVINDNFEIKSESRYLRNQIDIKLITKNKVEFSKQFLDADDSFSFKLEILKDADEKILFNSIGKISGLETIEINPFIAINFLLYTIKWIISFITILIVSILLLTSPLIVKSFYLNVFLKRKANNLFTKNKNNDFNNFDLFFFFFRFSFKDLKKIQELIKNKEDLKDYYTYLTTGTGKKDKRYYDEVEAEFHIKKGSADDEEIKIYLIDQIYKKLTSYLVFEYDELVIKSEDKINIYIEVILEHKKINDSPAINEYTFLME